MMQPKNYLLHCLKEGAVSRWNIVSGKPIQVYIEPFQWYHLEIPIRWEKYFHLVQEVLHLWSQVSEGVLSFALTRNEEEADILIQWQNGNPYKLSSCYRYVDEDLGISKAVIFIHLSHPLVEASTCYEKIKKMLTLELGRGLGLEPPEAPGYLNMASEEIGAPFYMTMEDSETLRMLYKLPVGHPPVKASGTLPSGFISQNQSPRGNQQNNQHIPQKTGWKQPAFQQKTLPSSVQAGGGMLFPAQVNQRFVLGKVSGFQP
ncbi:MAG: hypothetical protein K2X66_01645 [Cyanobacteria bacterium]|nr:hypothetical protein [Cyanobacteriota bacterium]